MKFTFINREFNIFPKGKWKWKWPIVLILFALIVAMDLYSSWLIGRITWRDWASFLCFNVCYYYYERRGGM